MDETEEEPAHGEDALPQEDKDIWGAILLAVAVLLAVLHARPG